MLKGLAKSAVIGAVHRRLGVPGVGPLSNALLTTGLSLTLVRGRRPVGLALLAAGGLLRWREIERAKTDAPPVRMPRRRAADASRATTPR